MVEATEKKLRDTRSSLQQQSGKKEAEYQQLIANINRSSTENITKLKEEKEQLRQALEQKLSQTIIALTSEKEGVEAGAREREKKLLAARDAMILQHDEALLRAENDKQQALLMAHQEHQAILERLEESNRALDIEQNKLERMRRDAQARADQDRNTANQLKDELASMKARLEEAKQFGYQKGVGASDAIDSLVDDIVKKLNDRRKVVGLFLDLSAAFDGWIMDHSILLNKLEHYGVRGQALEIFKSYLENRYQFIELKFEENGKEKICKSDIVKVTRGVPQGSILGPIFLSHLPTI
ncbi:unnamed protein product [Plutella xylostella]|uniref:(diamondback moth) hypothetical protein n=1 Tax=Plutella xylostella TaxID=51655 RepID=A0A8S4EYX1_PLUXY|nr:unnamed protein product [Plutella xylostella]